MKVTSADIVSSFYKNLHPNITKFATLFFIVTIYFSNLKIFWILQIKLKWAMYEAVDQGVKTSIVFLQKLRSAFT